MSSITPGWYPDPDPTASAGRQRWYDGAGWTEHVADPPPTTPVAPPAATPSFAPPYPGRHATDQQPLYGTPPVPMGGIPYAPPVTAQPPWDSSPSYGGRVAVGSMSKDEFKTLPRSLRVAKDRPDIDLARGRNSLAYNGVVAAAVSFVFSGFLVVPIVAIVWSARGLTRANMFAAQGYPPLGRSQATTGLALGIVSLVLGALALVVRLSSL
ncbi:DUF2510 domain-containing protein [Cellulomonas sp.]|uniref:DUF2510 domain-containing protein n=1 Tax=Cellulomonas sp. TaxID=40001 RepID=UPI003BAC25E2